MTNIRVTFSSKISNCLRTDPSNFCEYSSTTRIFHRPGGLTDLIASKNSVEWDRMINNGSFAQRQRYGLKRTVDISDDIPWWIQSKYDQTRNVVVTTSYPVYYHREHDTEARKYVYMLKV